LLQRKDLRKITGLAWAQDAPGSNPRASTNLYFDFASLRDAFIFVEALVNFSWAGGRSLQIIQSPSLTICAGSDRLRHRSVACFGLAGDRIIPNSLVLANWTIRPRNISATGTLRGQDYAVRSQLRDAFIVEP
jgi:hypothetical protein